MTITDLSRLRGRADAGDVYNRLIETYEIAIAGGSANVAPSNSLFVDAVRGSADGQRNSMSAPFANIQQAIDAAEPGDTIFLVTNLNDHHAVIPDTKPGIKIVGLGKFVTEWRGDNSNSDPTLIVQTGVTLQNIRLRGGDGDALFISGGANDVFICGVRFEDAAVIESCDAVRILDSDVEDISFTGCNGIRFSRNASDRSTYIGMTDSLMDLYSFGGNVYVDLYDNASLYVQEGSSVGSISCQTTNVSYISANNCRVDSLNTYANVGQAYDSSVFRYLSVQSNGSPQTFTTTGVTVTQSLSIGADVEAFMFGTNPPQGNTFVSGTLNALNAYNRTSAPTATDDETKCFRQGSIWVDDTNTAVYACISAPANNAVWVQLN